MTHESQSRTTTTAGTKTRPCRLEASARDDGGGNPPDRTAGTERLAARLLEGRRRRQTRSARKKERAKTYADPWEQPWNKTKTYNTYRQGLNWKKVRTRTGNRTRKKRAKTYAQRRLLFPEKPPSKPPPKIWEQSGNRTRRKRGKTRTRADQKARRDNNLVIADPAGKPPPPVQIRAAPPIFNFAR